MEFLLFLVFLALVLLGFASISYYGRILFLEPRAEYQREEIISLPRIWGDEIQKIMSSGGNFGIGFLTFFFSALLTYLWALLGGMIGRPHYSHSVGNYFFHFPLPFLLAIFCIPILERDSEALGGSESPWKILWEQGLVISLGLGAGSVAKCFSSYGFYHEMYFFFSLIVFLGIGSIQPFLWNHLPLLGFPLGQIPSEASGREGNRKWTDAEDWSDSATGESPESAGKGWDLDSDFGYDQNPDLDWEGNIDPGDWDPSPDTEKP
jgi:hypothetical protein